MPFISIIMPYKENRKAEGEIIAKFKIARGYFSGNFKQKNIVINIKCHSNTINNIIKKCRSCDPADEIWDYLKSNNHISEEKLLNLFSFLKNSSRKPLNCQVGLAPNSDEELILLRSLPILLKDIMKTNIFFTPNGPKKLELNNLDNQ